MYTSHVDLRWKASVCTASRELPTARSRASISNCRRDASDTTSLVMGWSCEGVTVEEEESRRSVSSSDVSLVCVVLDRGSYMRQIKAGRQSKGDMQTIFGLQYLLDGTINHSYMRPPLHKTVTSCVGYRKTASASVAWKLQSVCETVCGTRASANSPHCLAVGPDVSLAVSHGRHALRGSLPCLLQLPEERVRGLPQLMLPGDLCLQLLNGLHSLRAGSHGNTRGKLTKDQRTLS